MVNGDAATRGGGSERMADEPGVVIVGGGVVGLCCAFALCQRHVPVTVLDLGPPALAASHANAGWIVPSLAEPVPAPGLPRAALRWLLRPDSPFALSLRPDPDFLRWLVRFWHHCNARDFAAGLAAVSALALPTFALYDALRAAGVEYEEHRTGILFAYRRAAALQRDHATQEHLVPFGYPLPPLLDGEALRALEPALVPGLAGGFQIEQDRHLRPDHLVRGLKHWLRGAGVTVREGVKVTGFGWHGGQVHTLHTTAGLIDARFAVVCAGVWTPAVLRQVGVRLPIEMGKGYSLDFVPPPLSTPVRHALYLHEERVAITPFQGRLRFAGMMELSGLNHRLAPHRLRAISQAGSRIFTGWPANTRPATVWAGGRPLTPDGLPVIGLAPGFGNLAVASGHAMLGLTLGPATGAAIADLITTGTLPPVLTPFRVDRFA